MNEKELTPQEERLVAEIAALPKWQRETLRPLMRAAEIAHKHGVSLREFLEHAAGAYRGTDPADLPPKRT